MDCCTALDTATFDSTPSTATPIATETMARFDHDVDRTRRISGLLMTFTKPTFLFLGVPTTARSQGVRRSHFPPASSEKPLSEVEVVYPCTHEEYAALVEDICVIFSDELPGGPYFLSLYHLVKESAGDRPRVSGSRNSGVNLVDLPICVVLVICPSSSESNSEPTSEATQHIQTMLPFLDPWLKPELGSSITRNCLIERGITGLTGGYRCSQLRYRIVHAGLTRSRSQSTTRTNHVALYISSRDWLSYHPNQPLLHCPCPPCRGPLLTRKSRSSGASNLLPDGRQSTTANAMYEPQPHATTVQLFVSMTIAPATCSSERQPGRTCKRT